MESKKINDGIRGNTIVQNFLEQVARAPKATAINWKESGKWKSLDYSELAEEVSKVVTGLQSNGLSRNDKVILMVKNRFEFHVVDLAILFVGAIPVSVYNSYSAEQIVQVGTTTEAKMAVIGESFLKTFTDAKKSLPNISCVVAVGENNEHSDISYSELSQFESSDLAAMSEKVTQEDIATLIFTSGTTGEPKGVVLDHKNISSTVASLRELLQLEEYVGTKMISYLPMAHIAERMVSHYVGLLSGFELTCCPNALLVAEYAKEVKPNILFGVPRVYEKIYSKIQAALVGGNKNQTGFKKVKSELLAKIKVKFLSHKIREKVGLDELIIAVSGGAAISPEIMGWFRSIGVPLSEIYGLSETSGPLNWHPLEVKVGSVGPAIPGAEVKLADDGEVICRGDNIFRGYFNEPIKTKEVLDSDGWFSTGDIGEIDSDGYLSIVDRKKEIIVTSGGKNVAPVAIENTLKMIPFISQAMVVGDDRQYLTAIVTLEEEEATSWAKSQGLEFETLEELAESKSGVSKITKEIKTVMDTYSAIEKIKKVHVEPTEWEIDSELITPTSKLKRRAILAKYSDEIEAMYN